MRDILHDEIDQYEELTDEALLAVKEARGQLGNVIKKIDDWPSILTELTALTAKELTDVTTKAARAGVAIAIRRAKASK